MYHHFIQHQNVKKNLKKLQVQKLFQEVGGVDPEEALHLQQPEQVRREDRDRHVGHQEEGGEVSGLQIHGLSGRWNVPPR